MVLLIELSSSAEPTVIAPSALPGDAIRFFPSLPAATIHAMPFSVALFTRRDSAPVPLSPESLGSNALPIEPNDICPI
ncbi:MAG: Uncharacterised protein [Methanobacteriota archaeon]|nr:MAG: Uncharacterised protein [Euryarchaeota archaeon]